MTRNEYIEKVINLLKTKGWTQGAYARDADGDVVTTVSNHAACYCLQGAMDYVCMSANDTEANDVFDAYREVKNSLIYKNGEGIVGYNDTPGRTKEQVIDLLKGCMTQ